MAILIAREYVGQEHARSREPFFLADSFRWNRRACEGHPRHLHFVEAENGGYAVGTTCIDRRWVGGRIAAIFPLRLLQPNHM